MSFHVAVSYGLGTERENKAIQDCIKGLRSQGIQIHDLDKSENMLSCPERIDDSDIILVFCTPGFETYGDLLFVTRFSMICDKLENKPCIPVLISGKTKASIPSWANLSCLDFRPTNPIFNMRNMEVPLGMLLRRIEFGKMVINNKYCKEKFCPDCISINRMKKQERFIINDSDEEGYLRIILALGREPIEGLYGIYPELVVYEDPDEFLPDSEGNVQVNLARIGVREVDPGNKNYGAYYLEKPISFRIPEEMLYQENPDLISIVSAQLQQANGTCIDYVEADIDLLHEEDMEMPLPRLDIEKAKKDMIIAKDISLMKTALDLYNILPEVFDFE